MCVCARNHTNINPIHLSHKPNLLIARQFYSCIDERTFFLLFVRVESNKSFTGRADGRHYAFYAIASNIEKKIFITQHFNRALNVIAYLTYQFACLNVFYKSVVIP